MNNVGKGEPSLHAGPQPPLTSMFSMEGRGTPREFVCVFGLFSFARIFFSSLTHFVDMVCLGQCLLEPKAVRRRRAAVLKARFGRLGERTKWGTACLAKNNIVQRESYDERQEATHCYESCTLGLLGSSWLPSTSPVSVSDAKKRLSANEDWS